MDGTPAPYGVNQVGHGGPVNSDFSQVHPLARLPESQDPVGSQGRVPGRGRSSPVDLVVLRHGTGPPSLPWTSSQAEVVLPFGPGGSRAPTGRDPGRYRPVAGPVRGSSR